MDTTVTFRTDSDLKAQASELFASLGMSLTTALNMFMRQAVIKQRYPCSLEVEVAQGHESTYPKGFFDLFGSGAGLGLDEEPEDLPLPALELSL